jgi:hypothetical protein
MNDAPHDAAPVRITVELDPDVTLLVEEEQARQGKSFDVVVNDAIRRVLAPQPPRRPTSHYEVRPHHTTLRPGIDPIGLNRLPRLVHRLVDPAERRGSRTGRRRLRGDRRESLEMKILQNPL